MATSDVFAERLTQLRKKKDLKRQQVADDLGITRASLEFYEKGKRKPDIEMTARIAKYFQVSADYLLGLSKTPSTDKDIKGVCDYTGLSDIVIDRMFNNTKKNNPYNLAYLLNTIGNNTKTIKAFYFLVSHIVEFEVAAKRYYDLLAYCEIEKDEQLLNSLILQADSLKERMEIKQFRIEKEYRNLIEELIQIGDWDNGNNTQEE